jgi:hypothetical protein
VTIACGKGTNGPPAAGRRGGIKEVMFVGDEITLGAAYPDARAGLVCLTHGGWLSDASDHAYAEGLAGLVRVGRSGKSLARPSWSGCCCWNRWSVTTT